MTDPNLGGVEKLSVSKPCPGMMVGVPSLSMNDVVNDGASQGIIPPPGSSIREGVDAWHGSLGGDGLCLRRSRVSQGHHRMHLPHVFLRSFLLPFFSVKNM